MGQPFLGKNALHRRLHRKILLPHRRLWLQEAGMRRRRSGASCYPCGVHVQRRCGEGLYDISIVNGYNLSMLVVSRGGSDANCTNTGCVANLNGGCPSELRVTNAAWESVALTANCRCGMGTKLS